MRFLSFPILFLVKLCYVTESNFTKPVTVARTPTLTTLKLGFHVLHPAVSPVKMGFGFGVVPTSLNAFLCVHNGLIGQINAMVKDCVC